MLTLVVRFTNDSGSRDVNPLILLHGQPGTGKTTLCQGLAQKISMRLSSKHTRTKLFEIKTATLPSKYFSQSAKEVEALFSTISRMAEESEGQFICVLMDEVETIANSRERISETGEAQDSLRATNAFLTGLDSTKAYTNVIFLCTSNLIDCLDPAFLDRCAVKLAIKPPSKAIQYAILCGRLQKLISRDVITSEVVIPSFTDAQNDVMAKIEGRSTRILQLIRSKEGGSETSMYIPGTSIPMSQEY
jgi:SpoVK/Ycf46/Vps4 family AAA+-type ATPase